MKPHDATAAVLEIAREALHAARVSLDDLVAASGEVETLARKLSVDLETKRASRERTLASAAKATELDALLQSADAEIGALQRQLEIGQATNISLLARIDSMRTAQADRERRAAYDAAASNRARVAASIAPALAKMGTVARALMRDLAAAEIAVVNANRDLPSGCPKLASVEAARLAKPPEPVHRELRRGRFYVEETSGRVLGAEGQVAATPLADGKYDVILPGGQTSGGTATIATLAEMAEVEITEYVSRGWPQQLATELRVPGFAITDPTWWSIAPDKNAPAYPDEIIARLDVLENQPPASPLPPRVTTKLIPVAIWDAEHPASQKAA